MNMKNKFLIKIVIFVVMSAAMGNSAMGQKTGFAGEPQKILLRNDSETKELGIEPVEFQGDEDYAAYNWTIVEQPGGASLSNQYIAQPILTVTECGEHILQCVRCSKYGYQTEIVTIDVIDEVEVVSIECKHECFPVDSWTTKDDYIIETDPPGNEDLIDLVDDNSNKFLTCYDQSIQAERDVKFVGRRKDGSYYEPDVNKCEVKVINGNASLTVAEQSGGSVMRRLLGLFDALKGFEDLVKRIPIFRGLKKTDPLFFFDLKLSWALASDCCDHKKSDISLVTGSIGLQCGIQKRIPLWAGIAGWEFKFYAEASQAFNSYPMRHNDSDIICRDVKPNPFVFKLNGYIGLYIAPPSGQLLGVSAAPSTEFFDVAGGAYVNVSCEFPFDGNPGLLKLYVGAQAHIVVMITILSVDGTFYDKILIQ